MDKIFKFLVILVLPVFATHVAVLETGADGGAKDLVSINDRQYLTNVLREEAVKQLPAIQNYTIMTRENIQQMLPPGKAIEDCEGSCLVETGKNIAADYICQARIGNFGGELTLSAELYETAGNKLIASFNGRGADVKELLSLIEKKAPDFFRSIKGNSSGFAGVGGIGDVGGAGEFNFTGKKKFIVELSSTPTGALPTIDGKGIPKCTSTPCKIQVDEGNHRIVMSKDRFDDAEAVVDVKTNNQRIDLKLSPNFGFLDIKPVFADEIAHKGNLSIKIDGVNTKNTKIQLDPGVHNVRIAHPCYDPIEFKVSVAKNKTEVFDKQMIRGKGGLELNAEYNGEPQAVAVFIDGVESGSTPYTGEVPLCAEVTLKGKGWTEKVNVASRWHEIIQVTHKLKHSPESVAMSEDAIRADAQNAYNELDGKPSTQAGLSIPTNIDDERKSGSKRGIIIGVSAAIGVSGAILAVIGNNQAKEASKNGIDSIEQYKRNKDKAHDGQILRGLGIGLAIAGSVGIGISFAL